MAGMGMNQNKMGSHGFTHIKYVKIADTEPLAPIVTGIICRNLLLYVLYIDRYAPNAPAAYNPRNPTGPNMASAKGPKKYIPAQLNSRCMASLWDTLEVQIV